MKAEPSHPGKKFTDELVIAKLRSNSISRACREAAYRIQELTRRRSAQPSREGTL